MIRELHPEDLAYLIVCLEEERKNPREMKTDLPQRSEHKRRMAGFEANKIYFEIRKQELMKRYPKGTYIAIWKGLPVIVGDKSGEVIDEFYKQYGKQPVYVGKLSDELDIVEMSSPVSVR